jgi:hypothetical protein
MIDPTSNLSPQPRKSSTIAFLFSIIVLILGLNAVDFDYTGPNRPPSGTSCSRTGCFYTAGGTWPGDGHSYSCTALISPVPSGGCPSGDAYRGIFNSTYCSWPTNCDASWCGIGLSGCSSNGPGCSCSTTYYPPATISAYTDCSLPGEHGWCRGTATLNITADEPMAPNVITAIESSMGGLLPGCDSLGSDHATCTYTFPAGHSAFSFWALSTYGDQSASAGTSMDVDGEIPVLVDVLAPGAPGLRGWFRGGPVTLTCTASDAISGLDSLTYTGGTPVPGGVTVTSDGANTLTCTATDMAGNAVTASHTANVDSVPPTLEILYNGAPVYTGSGMVHITATASDATSGLYAYGFSVNGGPLETDVTLGDGYYTIVGYAEDNAGNTTTTGANVGVDTRAPATSWNAVKDWVRGTVTLSGHSEDAGSGVAAVFISFDGKNWIRAGSGPDWSYKWDTTTVPDGQYMILARATDVAGNEEHTAMLVIGVDNTAPEVAVEGEWSIPDTGGAGGSDNLSGIARAHVTISGNGIAAWSRDYNSVPSAIAWDGTDGNGARAPYGDYDVTIEAWDRAGNYSVTHGVIHYHPPTIRPTPTPAKAAVVVPPAPAQPAAPQPVVEPPAPEPALPPMLPLWSLVLPMGGLGVWLAGSTVAFARDRRWSELRGIARTVARYKDQTQTNFPQEGEND